MIGILIPFWVNDILKAFAWQLLLARFGPINNLLIAAGVIAEPFPFLNLDVGVIVGLIYAYLLFMLFPLYSAMESLDPNQLDAARDLGAPGWRIHWDIVIPHAKPGIASGCIVTFMLAAGILRGAPDPRRDAQPVGDPAHLQPVRRHQLEPRGRVRTGPGRAVSRVRADHDVRLPGQPARHRAMTSPGRVRRAVVVVYLAVFFVYMFLPLAYMMAVAFNDTRIPTLNPWRGFTLRWFVVMWEDTRMWQAVWKSAVIAFWVIVLSVPLGLAGALLMTRLQVPGKPFVYAVLVSPVLTPGIIIGLSTLIFWDTTFDIGGRWPLSVLGQSSFISAYCMLLFMARLQRFDPTLEEAALDLGATPLRVFWTITLPYMRPAILAAVALSFFQSFENYNTTVFTIGNDLTFTMFIVGKVRKGVQPDTNALAFVLVAVTIVGGIVYEVVRRREARRAETRVRAAMEGGEVAVVAPVAAS